MSRDVGAQVEFESKVSKQVSYFNFKRSPLSSRHFQHGFHGVNLHRLTVIGQSARVWSPQV